MGWEDLDSGLSGWVGREQDGWPLGELDVFMEPRKQASSCSLLEQRLVVPSRSDQTIPRTQVV